MIESKLKKIEAIIFIVNDKNIPQFLVCKRPPDFGGYWQFVTGKGNNDESLEETLRREIKEEIGVTNIEQIVDTDISFSFRNYNNAEVIEHVFLVKLSQDTTIKLNYEFEKYDWFLYQDALGILSWANQKTNLEQTYQKYF